MVEGDRCDRLALQIGHAFEKPVWLRRAMAGYYGTIYSRMYPTQNILEQLRRAERMCMSAGDVEYGMLNACWSNSEFLPLPELDNNLRIIAGRVAFYVQTLSLVMIKPLWQMAMNL
jgi:hypothetical protein